MNKMRQRVSLLHENLLRVANPDGVFVVALGESLGQRGGESAERLAHKLLRLGLARAKERDEHLQDDLLRRLIRLEEVAHVDEGPLLGAAVLRLEMVPAELDELLAMAHELVGEVTNEKRAETEELNAHGLGVYRGVLVVRRLEQIHNHRLDSLLGDDNLRLRHLDGIRGDVLQRVLEHRKDDEPQRGDEL